MFDLDQFSAQDEEHFREHWMYTPYFMAAARRNIPIVLGAKGSGKSALLRYLTQLQSESDITYPGLDLTEFRHERVRSQVRALVGELSIDDGMLLANYWRHLFLLHCMHDVSVRVNPSDEREQNALETIRSVLARNAIEPKAHDTLLGYLIRAKRYLDECLLRREPAAEPPLRGGLTRLELSRLENLPDDDEFTAACLAAAGLLVGDRRHVCLVVDGLDRVKESDHEAHAFVLNTIINAVRHIARDQSLKHAFSVKVLVPRELFLAVSDRDMDQYGGMQAHLHWDPESLTSLLERRLAAACQRAGGKADTKLSDLLPEMLPNGQLTLEFLIRHTMYRPRQLLMYAKAIAESARWQVSPPAQWQKPVGETIIKHVVSVSIEASDLFIREYALKFPMLKEMLDSLAGLTNVTTLNSLEARLRGKQGLRLSALYECGALGIVQLMVPGSSQDPSACYQIINGQKRPIDCEFSYKATSRPSWIPDLPGETLVAIHPMLTRHCRVNVDPDFVIG